MPNNRVTLFDLGIDEVSTVDKGDNLGADILFWKHAPNGMDPVSTPSADGLDGVTDADIQALIKSELEAKGLNVHSVILTPDGTAQIGPAPDVPPAPDGMVKAAITRFAEMFGWSSDQVAKATEAVTWTPPDFDAVQGRKFVPKVHEELAEMLGSLTDSLMMAADSDQMAQNLTTSVDQFKAAVDSAVKNWSAGKSAFTKDGRKMSAARLTRIKEVRDTLNRLIQDVAPVTDPATDDDQTTEKRKDGEMAIDMDALAPEVRAEIEKARGERDELQKQLDAKGQTPDPNAQPEQSELEKALGNVSDEATREVLRKIAEQGAQDASRVAEMEKAAQETVYIQKARDFGWAEPEEVGKAYRRVTLGVAEDGDVAKVEAAIEASRGQAATSQAITDQISKGREAAQAGDGTALAKANELAQEIRKTRPELSLEGARAEVWSENPTLRERHEAETNGKVA